MATEKKRPVKKSTTTDRGHATKKRSSFALMADGRVRMGSEVGVTLPVGDSTAHIRFSFWHERIAKNDSQEELKRTAAQIDEFNEAELERRIRQYQRLIRRVSEEEDESTRARGGRKKARGR